MFIIEEELKKLPKKPGVYLMKDKDDKIIYVGKAINLKNRVSSYFRKTDKTNRILKMVSLIDHFEYIVVDNEAEALILECNLIKKNRPKFNVLLKDDKTYPYIKVDVKSEYPNVAITRKVTNDGSKYFGPYANPGAAKEMLNFIKQKYKIRQCRNFKYNDRPCLNYHIKRCLAPCQGYVSHEEYMEQINEIIDLLEGKTDKILKDLKNQMKEASEKQEYEKAAYIRDRMVAIERASSMQKVSNISENNIDVIGLAKSEFEICIEVFFVRGSKMIGREHYFFTDLNDMEESEVIAGFIKQFYMDNLNIPNKIMIKEVLENEEVLEKWLSTIAEHKVEIHSTKRGQKLKFVEMAENNAKVTLENKEKQKNNILLELKDVLKMDKMPRKIETYDISNISGNFMVAAMCVLKDGEIKKNLSRRFRIKSVFTQDDPRCMEEVITRRLAHSVQEPSNEDFEKSTDNKESIDNKVYKISTDDAAQKETTKNKDNKREKDNKALTKATKNKANKGTTKKQAFGELPDAIFADGGITQIRAIRRAIDKYNVPIKIFGMVKNDKHQTRALIDEDRNEIKISPELMLLITRFQDTVHDTAISYYRKLHEKSLSHSELDDIKGIGEAKKKALIKAFGSVEKIKQASVEELCEVKGINREIAEEIKRSL